MVIFFFEWRLMPTARKGIAAVCCKILTPLRQRAVRHSQVAVNWGLRFLAGLQQVYRLDLKLFRVRFLLFLHGTCSPLWISLFRVYSLHKGGPGSLRVLEQGMPVRTFLRQQAICPNLLALAWSKRVGKLTERWTDFTPKGGNLH